MSFRRTNKLKRQQPNPNMAVLSDLLRSLGSQGGNNTTQSHDGLYSRTTPRFVLRIYKAMEDASGGKIRVRAVRLDGTTVPEDIYLKVIAGA